MTTTAPETTHLDVRAVLASGGEPFDLIMAAAERIAPGNTLELIAPFEPVPLYAVMRRRGFARTTETRGAGEWVVTFRNTAIVPSATVAAVAEQHPNAREVFTRHGLDLCCGGSKTLAFAAEAHGIDLDRLLEELQG